MSLVILLPIAVFLAFVLGIVLGQSGREKLRRELAYALGQLKESNDKADKMSEIAGKALEFANEKHFPSRSKHGSINVHLPQDNYHATPDPFRVENCPACLVSVRASEWPQECPACHSIFGFESQT